MNYDNATKQQLLQVALNEECDTDLKYKAVRQLQIRFTINKYRKGSTNNNLMRG